MPHAPLPQSGQPTQEERTFGAPTLPSRPRSLKQELPQLERPELPPPMTMKDIFELEFGERSPEVWKKVMQDFHRIFAPEDVSSMDRIEINMALMEILDNARRRGNENAGRQMTDQEIRNLSTNPPRRLGPLPGLDI
jgi:hypothetical protein